MRDVEPTVDLDFLIVGIPGAQSQSGLFLHSE